MPFNENQICVKILSQKNEDWFVVKITQYCGEQVTFQKFSTLAREIKAHINHTTSLKQSPKKKYKQCSSSVTISSIQTIPQEL